jgi:type 1 fimbria pilin
MALIRLFRCGIAVLLTCVASLPAQATSTCNDQNANNTLAIGTLPIPAGAAVGSTVSTLAPVNFIVQCRFLGTGSQGASTVLTGRLSTAATLAPGFIDVYSTSIPGLGVRYTMNSSASQCNIENRALASGSLTFTCPYSGPINGPYMPYSVFITASLVVTGPITPGATTLASAPLISFALTTEDSGGPWPQPPAYNGSASGTLSRATCSVDMTDIAVVMPRAESRNLASIGATTGPASFSLTLSCEAGATVLITLTDGVDPANRSTTLRPHPESTARGVGVQILDGAGVPVAFGPDSAAPGNTNQWSLGAAPNGSLNVPMTARYVRTGALSPGSVRALATFTMSYR